MTIDELTMACHRSMQLGLQHIQLASPNRKAPFPRKGWPRGELLCFNSFGGSVWLYEVHKIVKAIGRFRKENEYGRLETLRGATSS